MGLTWRRREWSVGRELILIGVVGLAAAASVASGMTAAADSVDGLIDTNLPPQVALTSPTDGFVVCSGARGGSPPPRRTSTMILQGPADHTGPPDHRGRRDRPAGVLPERPTARHRRHRAVRSHGRPGSVRSPDRREERRVRRAFDADKPQLSADSQTVSFLMVDPPPGLPDHPDPCLQATPPINPPEPAAPQS